MNWALLFIVALVVVGYVASAFDLFKKRRGEDALRQAKGDLLFGGSIFNVIAAFIASRRRQK